MTHDETATTSGADPAEQAVEGVRLLFTTGVLSHSGHANVSARVDDRRFRLTTRVTTDLRPDELALVGVDGTLHEGQLTSENAEIVAMHAAVYTARPDVGGVIHTHSPAATTFALAHRALPCRTEALLRFGQAEPVPVVPWGPRGSDVSVRGVIEALRLHPMTGAILLANHGLLAFAADPVATGWLVAAIEEAAELELAATALGGAVDFPDGALEAVQASMARARALQPGNPRRPAPPVPVR